MIEVTNVKDFCIHNNNDIERILKYLLSDKGKSSLDLKDINSIDDLVQMWYVYCIKYNTIEKFDPQFACFRTYIYNCAQNFLSSIMNKERNSLKNLPCISTIITGDTEHRVYDLIQAPGSYSGKPDIVGFSVSYDCDYDSIAYGDRCDKVEKDLIEFRKYIKSINKSENTKIKMDKVMELSWEGLTNIEISQDMRISSMAVGNIKRTLGEYFKKFSSGKISLKDMR